MAVLCTPPYLASVAGDFYNSEDAHSIAEQPLVVCEHHQKNARAMCAEMGE